MNPHRWAQRTIGEFTVSRYGGPVETAVLVPVKSFESAKARLRPHIPDPERAQLARWMAGRVLEAVRDHPTFVACDADIVASWAEARGATVLWGAGLGLNGAIDQGVETIADLGIERVTIAHGDLPLPEGIGRCGNVGPADGIVLVPDGWRDGTNIQSRPTHLHFPARYGAGSFGAHLAQALDSGAPVSVRVDQRLAIDIDTIRDCRHPLVRPLLRWVFDGAIAA